MQFAEIKYSKTVEGNFEVQLIDNNTVVATIVFPTEALAAEYVDIKQKLKVHAEALIAEVLANLNTKAATVATKVETEVKAVETGVVAEVETKVENFVANIKNRVEKAAHIDTSAKVAVQPRIDTSAKVGSDATIDTSAKIVVPE